MECAYCSDEAIGYDAEDAPTCGNEATCTPAVRRHVAARALDS